MPDSKYQKHVLTQPRVAPLPQKIRSVSTFGLDAPLMAAFPNMSCNLHFLTILAPQVLADPPHKHICDELLFFISTEPENTADLGGEVEIALGDEWEKHVITTSAIVCLPKGVNHAPIYIRKVDRPFYFGHLLLASTYESSNLNAM
jgi:hypothetical protein